MLWTLLMTISNIEEYRYILTKCITTFYAKDRVQYKNTFMQYSFFNFTDITI